MTISSVASLSLDFLLSIEKSEYKQIIDRLLKLDSGSAVEGEKRLMLCDAVAAATHTALGDNVLGRARDIAAFNTATVASFKKAEDLSTGGVDLVKSEMFAVQLILDSIDKSIGNMLGNGSIVEEMSTSTRDQVTDILKKQVIAPPLVAAAESRLNYLSVIATNQSTPSDSIINNYPAAFEAASRWRSSCADVSASELDGLLRLRFLCTAYHISLLSSL